MVQEFAMRHAWIIGLAALVLTLTAQAQPAGRPGRGPRDGPPGPRGGGLDVVAGRLADELKLTDEQRTQYDALVAKFQAQAAEPAQENNREELRALAEQLRAARQSGDEKKAEEIRAQMRALRPGRGGVVPAFLDEVATILTPEQQKILDEFRDRQRQRDEGARRGGDVRELIRTLPEELGLSDEQKTRFDELLAEHRQQMRERAEQAREARPQLEKELQQAHEAGDEARVAELEAKLEAQRPEVAGFQDLFDRLQSILTPEQKTKLEKLRAELTARARPAAGDVQSLLRAARRLELNDEQEGKLRKIAQDARQTERQGAPNDPAQAELAKTIKSQIIELLDAEQKAEFERLLADERPGRAGRPGPGGRPGRGGPPPAGKTPA
jgi:Spy/CpxP family protein refolding chaperone